MKKNLDELEKMITTFFEDHKPSPLIINSEDFITIKENYIFDAQVISQLQSTIEAFIGNGHFVIINDDSVNACAMEKDGVLIIALYAGTIKKLMYDACIMMLSDEFFPEVGDLAACYPGISTDDYPLEANGDEIKIVISGDPTREAIGYMIANLAIQFIAYHEVGHHKLGHVRNAGQKGNLFYGETQQINEEKNSGDRKKMELEADAYAMDLILEKLDYLMKSWEAYLNLPFTYTEMFQLVISALVIIKENMPTNAFLPNEIEKSHYLPSIIRISLSTLIMSRQPHIKKALYHDICKLFKENNQSRRQFENQNSDICVFDNTGQLTDDAYIRYCSLLIVAIEQIYADIFKGTHSSAVFQLDLVAAIWFLYLYK